MPNRLAFTALAVAFIALTISNSPLRAQFAQERREIRIGISGVPTEIEPGMALEGAGPLIQRQIFDTLVAYNPASTDIEPALATRWISSREGLVWTFILRDNVRFHDGKALSAADVVASLERPLKIGTRPAAAVWSALLRGAPGVVKAVRAVDARTVQVILTQPYAPLLTVLAHPGFGVARQVGAGADARLVGTGPYRLTDLSGGRVVLEAFPNHWAGLPHAERLVFLDIEDNDHAEAELSAQALDVWFPPGPPRRTQGALSIPGPRVGYLAFQTERDLMSRKKIRQAIAAAIDPAVIGAALGSGAVPLQSYLPPGVWARREGSPVLGGARKTVIGLLKEGRWPAGSSVTLLAPDDAGAVDTKAVAEALQLSLEAVNIDVKLRIEPPELAAAARAAGDHDMTLAEATVIAGDPHLFLYPLSTSEGAVKGRPTFNVSFYRNPQLDDVLVRASQLAFRPERQRLYQRAQAVLAEEMPWLPLYVKLLWAVARPEVRGLRLHPTGFPRLSTVLMEAGLPAGPLDPAPPGGR
ncbi:MAG TPA: ABC transporter substrate-binding protein [Methylomirabilota bacterium]|nr:ABC transporter substrate-binding protein [Methylomirabilota bacterium]